MSISNDKWIWWKDGVIYQIYPRSFYDSNGDGIGDIRGIIEKIDYLEYLGIDAVWLSPINRSPMDDFGYDIKDYRRIESIFGTEADFDELIKIFHEKNIKIIFDLVMNHTSSSHLWFVESRSSKTNPKRDWYIWQKAHRGKYPNNWRAAFGGRAWEYDKITGEYYLHSFLKQQPDINWRNNDLRNAVFDDIKFWLDRGIDGFRLDVVNWFIKDEKLRNNPYTIGYSPRIYDMQNHIYDRNRPETHDVLKDFRKLLDSYPERMSVGEVFSPPPGDARLSSEFIGNGKDQLDMAFDFSLMYVKWNAKAFYKKISTWLELVPADGWPCHVLSNHDQSRQASRFYKKKYTDDRCRILAVLLLTLKGTPFIYYGEEIGMRDGKISRSKLRDPLGKKYWPFFKGRDPERTPMQWQNSDNAGFTSGIPWLPLNSDYWKRNVYKQIHEKNSLLNLYKFLIELRRKENSLRRGEILFLEKGESGIISYTRGDEFEIVLNFENRVKQYFPRSHDAEIVFSTDAFSKVTESKILNPYEAVILRHNQQRNS